MDSLTKTGQAYLQLQKAGKKWKPVWLSLFSQSSSEAGRLEIQDMRGGEHSAGVKGHLHHHHLERKLKVVRLSDVISVLRLPPNAEACPMDNMSAFCVETQARTMVFAAFKEDCMEWVEKLNHNTFQQGAISASDQSQMEENPIYSTTDEVSEFWVVVQRTDAATRCGLKGSYWLKVGRETLQLKDPQKKNIVMEWPYKLLRRYGKDKLALTIEAGRRCDSGPGSFTFETQQNEKIFSLIQSTIKRKTVSGNPNQEDETIIQAHSPLPKIPDMTNMAALLENKLKTHEGKSAAAGVSPHSPEGSSEPAPITLMPLPRLPTHVTHPLGKPKQQDQPDAVYADPADCIQNVPALQPTTALYVDPASVLPLKPPGLTQPVTASFATSTLQHGVNIPLQDSVYSEVFDKISPVPNEPKTCPRNKGQTKLSPSNEPIYTEPVKVVESDKQEPKPDPFAHLYAQVCKTQSSKPALSPDATPSCSASSATEVPTETMDPYDDVIYENLGII